MARKILVFPLANVKSSPTYRRKPLRLFIPRGSFTLVRNSRRNRIVTVHAASRGNERFYSRGTRKFRVKLVTRARRHVVKIA